MNINRRKVTHLFAFEFSKEKRFEIKSEEFFRFVVGIVVRFVYLFVIMVEKKSIVLK